jgi:uncharacterized membrane protein YGL010W
MSKDSIFNFEYQFVKYGEFHHNKINQIIHIIFVPLILWTAQVWLSKISPYLNYVLTATYAAYYLVLNIKFGLLIMPLLTLSSFYAFQFSLVENSLALATAAHFASWIFQIFGHAVFEKRAPAFTKDPLQAVIATNLVCTCAFICFL